MVHHSDRLFMYCIFFFFFNVCFSFFAGCIIQIDCLCTVYFCLFLFQCVLDVICIQSRSAQKSWSEAGLVILAHQLASGPDLFMLHAGCNGCNWP